MGEKTEKIERIEKNKGKTMNEIILDMERGTGSSSQVGRILDSQTEIMAKRLEKSNMEQLMAEAERKRIEEEMRLKQVQNGSVSPTPQPPQAPQEAKNILEAVKVGLDAGKPQKSEGGSLGEVIKGMAEMFKTGVEVGRGQNQPQQPQQNPLETMKQYNDMFLKPVLDQLNSKDREIMTMRMNQIESKITAQVSPQEYIKQIKESANTLGLTGGGRTEIDLKLAEMAQTERLEGRKLDWEVQKHGEDKEDMKEIYGLIGKAIDGPISDFTKGVGAATAKRIESGAKKGSTPQIMQIPCPACHQSFDAIAGAPQVICPHCKSVLALQTQAPEQPAQPAPPQETQAQPSETQQPTEASQPAQEQPEQPK